MVRVGIKEEFEQYVHSAGLGPYLSGKCEQHQLLTESFVKGFKYFPLESRLSFMLYDEPTSALDPELAQEVLQVIKDLAESGNGQIVVTHHLEFARKVADRIVFLEEGQVTFNGSSQAFFESDNPRIQLYLQQLL